MAKREKHKPNVAMKDPHHAAPPAAGETVGGASSKDEMAATLLNKVISWGMTAFSDWRPVDHMLRNLSPIWREAAVGIPFGINYAATKMPLSWFSSRETAEIAQNIIEHAATKLEEIIESKAGQPLTTDDLNKALDAAYASATKKPYPAANGVYHKNTTCIAYTGPRRAPKQGDNGQQQQGGQQMYPLDELIAGGNHACTHCWPDAANDLRKIMAQPAAEPKKQDWIGFKQPLEIIGGCPDADLRTAFTAWFTALGDTDRERVIKAFAHLDSLNEFRGFMSLDASTRLMWLPRLENKDGSLKFKGYLSLLGQAIEAGAGHMFIALKAAWGEFVKLDDMLEPTVTRMEQLLRGETPTQRPRSGTPIELPWYAKLFI